MPCTKYPVQTIFQTYQYIIIRPTVEHVRFSQRYSISLHKIGTSGTNDEEVSDVFHTGSPDSALWEFKHGNGNFKRGDLVGLREIKRRASRHALIHRDSFSNHKPGVPQQGAPSEPIHDATEQRFLNLEHSLYDMHSRLARSEESNAALSARCQTMADSLVKCCQVCDLLILRITYYHCLNSS